MPSRSSSLSRVCLIPRSRPTAAAALVLVALACAPGSERPASTVAETTRIDAVATPNGAPGPNGDATGIPADSLLRPDAPLMAPPDVVRGLYVNRWAAIGTRLRQLIEVARTTEVNALVIDVKDDRGYLLYRSGVPLAREIGADTVMPMPHARLRAVLDTMRAHGVYPIARIVVVKDPLLAEAKPAWAIRRQDDSTRPWLDRGGKPWLDPHHPDVWTYAADIAREAVALGFSEIQLDYVRFPDEQRLVREAAFPLAAGRARAQVIREQLGRMRDTLRSTGVPFAIDVFGLTTSDTTDMGIGQRWEMFVDRADAVLPMMYPSHYSPGNYGLASPNAQPYAVIERGLRDAKRRSAGVEGAGAIIPWYQDFTLGAPPYGPAEIRAQMQAGYDNGIRSWILWNPGSRYTLGALRPDGEERKPDSDADGERPVPTSPAAPPRR